MKLQHGSEAALPRFRRGADTDTQRERPRHGVGHPSLGQTRRCCRTRRRRHGPVVGCGADRVVSLYVAVSVLLCGKESRKMKEDRGDRGRF